jgi:hypothetical protein
MIDFQSSPGRQAKGLRHSNRGHRPRNVMTLEPLRPVSAPQYPCPSVVKKGIFTKRTQMENHKSLPFCWMRKISLASFSKTNPFLFGLGLSKAFKGIQSVSKDLKKKYFFQEARWPWDSACR